MNDLVFRPVERKDCALLFKWANQADVRSNSIKSNVIEWTEHQNWFESKLNVEHSKMFILENQGIPVAQIRFEFRDGEWYVNFSVAANERGKGYGKIVVKKGLECLSDTPVVALVKMDNKPSLAVFTSLGFKILENINVEGTVLVKFVI